MHRLVLPLATVLAAASAHPAGAQSFGQNLGQTLTQGLGTPANGQGTAPSVGGLLGNAGGVSGLLGRFAPAVSSAPTGNLAGLLSYCVQNDAVPDQAAASGTLSALNRQDNATALPGYAQGQQGILQPGSGNPVAVSSLGGQLKSRLCSMVMQRARSLL